jgi:hypothetical protein
MQRRTYGYAKQGSGFGHTKIGGKSVLVRGLNVLLATVSTPLAAPVVTGSRLRGGRANSARGAASFLAESITTARAAGASGTLLMRGDSAFYNATALGTCRRHDVRFSVTAKMDPKIKKAIAAIDEDAWIAIKYPNAIFDDQAGCWVSDAEIAEIGYTAFASKIRRRPRPAVHPRGLTDPQPRSPPSPRPQKSPPYPRQPPSPSLWTPGQAATRARRLSHARKQRFVRRNGPRGEIGPENDQQESRGGSRLSVIESDGSAFRGRNDHARADTRTNLGRRKQTWSLR